MKLGKLNQLKLDLSETQIIDSIAQGIQDEGICRTVLTARFQRLSKFTAGLGIFTAAPAKPKEGGGDTDPRVNPWGEIRDRERWAFATTAVNLATRDRNAANRYSQP